MAFALLAAMITSRYRIAGTVGLTVLLAAGLLGRQALHSFLSRRGREHSLARLTVPLLVPDLSGYQVQWAYPVGGVLSIGLTAASTPAGLPGGRTPRIQILIEPVPPGFAPPAVSPDVQPSPAIMAAAGTAPWQSAGPGRWTRRDRNIVQLTERHPATSRYPRASALGVALAGERDYVRAGWILYDGSEKSAAWRSAHRLPECGGAHGTCRTVSATSAVVPTREASSSSRLSAT